MSKSQGHVAPCVAFSAMNWTHHAKIKKMKDTIVDEGVADKEQLDWCKSERTNSDKDLDSKKSQIKTLKGEINKLDDTINLPKTGLKDSITAKEESLVQNRKAQVEETATRKEENQAYRVDVSNLADAEDILAKAIRALKRYYDQLDKHMKENKDTTNFLQEDPAPPKTYDAFEGQSDSGGKAIEMLQFILSETKKEHKKADDDESSAQSDFDKSIKELKTSE